MMDVGKQVEEQHIQQNYRLYGQFLQPAEMNTCGEMMHMRMTERGCTASFSVSLIPVQPSHNHITDPQCISLWYLC